MAGLFKPDGDAVRNDEICEELIRLLNYDPETGKFTWKVDRAQHKAGAQAGILHPRGYRITTVHGQAFKEHRLAWFMTTGHWPAPYEVDHINLVKDDNRWSNLRFATVHQNLANQRVRKNNKCGLKGVVKNDRCATWSAEIRIHGIRKYLGCFRTPEAAHAAYMHAATEAFGEFARAS